MNLFNIKIVTIKNGNRPLFVAMLNSADQDTVLVKDCLSARTIHALVAKVEALHQ